MSVWQFNLIIVIVFGIALSFATPDFPPNDNYGPCTRPWGDQPTISLANAFCNAPNREKAFLNVTQGTIPTWLQGTLYRNVPAKYSFGPDQVQHWFDAESQVNAITLDGSTNTAYLRAKFVNTTDFHNMCSAGRYNVRGAYTWPYPGPLMNQNSTKDGYAGPKVVNVDVSLLNFGGKFMETTDEAMYVEIDKNTLDVVTPDGWNFNDKIGKKKTVLSVTHGAVDMESNEYYGIANEILDTVVGLKAKVNFWRMNGARAKETGTWTREFFAMSKSKKASYSHSIGLSKNFVVWFENPMWFDTIKIPTGTPIMRLMSIAPNNTVTKIHLVNRNTGAVRIVTIPVTKEMPFFGWMIHTGNVFEDPEDGSLVYDGSHMTENVYANFYTQNAMMGHFPVTSKDHFFRCRIYPWSDVASCKSFPKNLMFPWYNKRYHMRPYRFAYNTNIIVIDAQNPNTAMPGSVHKLDMSTNQSIASYTPKSRYLTEAIFMPRNTSMPPPPPPAGSKYPSEEEENDGVLLTVEFDFLTNTSAVVGLNPSNLTVMFEVNMPFAIPQHLHGIFCSATEDFCLWN